MAVQQTIIQGTCYDVLGNLAATRLVRVMEARRSGELIEIENQHGVVNASGLLKAADGVSDFKLPRNSQVKLTARIVGLDTLGGVWVTVPDSAGPIDLATLITVSSVPTTGITVKDEGVALASLIGTFNFIGAGVTVTQTADGVAELDFSAGSGAPTAATYITQTPHASLSAEQALSALATGLLKNTTATGVLSIATAADLPSGIDAAKIGGGLVSNTEFDFLNGVTSSIQDQINAQLTQAEADALYSVLAHNHSGVYEPIDANITRLGSSIDLSGAEATGILADARFPATLPVASGVNLTALNASNLGSGTVPDARFPATLPAISGANLTGLTKSQIGLGSVDNVQQQPLDATLTALAGLTVAADKLIYATGADAFAVTDLSAFGRGLIDDADAAAAQATLGLVIGTNVQAFSARLSEVATIGTALQQIRVNAGATALEYFTPSGGGGTPGGSDTHVQFNDGGAFGGDAGLTYNKATDSLTAVGVITADKFKTSGPYVQASNINGNTVAILAGDFNTYRRLVAGGFIIGPDDMSTADVQYTRVDTAVAGISNASGGGAVLEMAQVAALGTVSANSGRIGVKDVAGTAEWFVKDEAGNETQISPHDGDKWVFRSFNEKTGRRVWVDMELLVKTVESKLGVTLMKEWRQVD